MRATDLIGCEVYDADGVRVGRVHDLHFELSLGRREAFRCELTALDCSRPLAVGHRLGYGTGDMAGPWPLKALFTRYQRCTVRTIRWADVAHVGDRGVRLRIPQARLDQEAPA